MDLGANIVNAGNYSMRPHAFSTEHFERNCTLFWFFDSSKASRASALNCGTAVSKVLLYQSGPLKKLWARIFSTIILENDSNSVLVRVS